MDYHFEYRVYDETDIFKEIYTKFKIFTLEQGDYDDLNYANNLIKSNLDILFNNYYKNEKYRKPLKFKRSISKKKNENIKQRYLREFTELLNYILYRFELIQNIIDSFKFNTHEEMVKRDDIMNFYYQSNLKLIQN